MMLPFASCRGWMRDKIRGKSSLAVWEAESAAWLTVERSCRASSARVSWEEGGDMMRRRRWGRTGIVPDCRRRRPGPALHSHSRAEGVVALSSWLLPCTIVARRQLRRWRGCSARGRQYASNDRETPDSVGDSSFRVVTGTTQALSPTRAPE